MLQDPSIRTMASLAIGAAIGFAFAQFLSSRRITDTAAAAVAAPSAAPADAPPLPEVPPGELKMVLIARSDLKMKPGNEVILYSNCVRPLRPRHDRRLQEVAA
jgi:hypothetical protein